MTCLTASLVSCAIRSMQSLCVVVLPVPVSTWNNESAVDKVKSWTFFNNESEPVHPPSSQMEWLITIGAVQHVWRKVSE
jgi:hypothetical protein